jgi:hypothetical protein
MDDVNIELNRNPIGVLNVTFGRGALHVQKKKNCEPFLI